MALKLLYAIGAGVLSVWWLSFYPSEGPPIERLIPSSARVAFLVRDGHFLIEKLPESRALQELLQDVDVNTLFDAQARRDKLLAEWRKLPSFVQWLFPPDADGLQPLLGRDSALAVFPALPPEAGQRKGLQPVLLLARLSGARGQLLRVASRFAKLPRGVQMFDLGGGLVACGIDGAQPARPLTPVSLALARPSPSRGEGTFVATLVLQPPKPDEKKDLPPVLQHQWELLRDEGVPEPVLKALKQPPALSELFGISQPPAEVRVNFYAKENGSLNARGWLDRQLPQPCLSPSGSLEKPSVYASAFIPLDAHACFLRFIESDMRLRKIPPPRVAGRPQQTFTKGQKNWIRRFQDLSEQNFDLDRALWPAAGHVVEATIGQPPPGINPAGYGLLNLALPFNGKHTDARDAFGALIGARWDLFDKEPRDGEPTPYVRRMRHPAFDRYVLATGQITAPSWTLTDKALLITSDAGPFALRDKSASPPPEPFAQRPGKSYFLKIDGQRLAATSEALADAYYQDWEDEIGPAEFLEQCPNRDARVHLAGKLTHLLGSLSINATPDAEDNGTHLDIVWNPGSLASSKPKKQEEESVPAPPP
ncbi:MAG TPA: hypothetical protein VGP72_20890 [Planctomycetota bacterium]|jgi:hypothetical protein